MQRNVPSCCIFWKVSCCTLMICINGQTSPSLYVQVYIYICYTYEIIISYHMQYIYSLHSLSQLEKRHRYPGGIGPFQWRKRTTSHWLKITKHWPIHQYQVVPQQESTPPKEISNKLKSIQNIPTTSGAPCSLKLLLGSSSWFSHRIRRSPEADRRCRSCRCSSNTVALQGTVRSSSWPSKPQRHLGQGVPMLFQLVERKTTPKS